MNRRLFIEGGLAAAVATVVLASLPEIARAAGLPFEQGKYQTFPGLWLNDQPVLQDIDLGTLGPDVDTLAGMDFAGDIPTGALVVSNPADGVVKETRVVFLKRIDLDYVQINKALRGDRFDMHKVSEFGIDNGALDAMARLHAKNTAHTHQKVVYLGDLGLFEKTYGAQEQPLLKRIIRAQRPGVPAAGIPDSNFSFPRTS